MEQMLLTKYGISGEELFHIFALYRNPFKPEVFLDNINRIVPEELSRIWDNMALQLNKIPNDALNITIHFGEQIDSPLPNYKPGMLGWKDCPTKLTFSRRETIE